MLYLRYDGQKQQNNTPNWHNYHKTRYPERQSVMDMMYSYGVEIAEAPDGIYYLRRTFSATVDDVLRMTGFHAFSSGPRTYGVRMDGREYEYFYSLQDAYWALEYLYNRILIAGEEGVEW